MKKLFLALCLLFLTSPALALAADTSSTYDKIKEAGKIHCGYGLWPTYLEIDPNTGEFSGIWYELTNEIGKLLNLDIEWSAEVPYSDVNIALSAGRIDAFCSGLWRDVTRAADVDYSDPITYQAIVPVVRADDTRFDDDLSKINDPSVKVLTIDGEMSQIIYDSDFPKAKAVGLPNLTEPSQGLLNVATGKADVMFTSPETTERYLENNPGSLKAIHTDQPLRLFAEVYAFYYKEHELRRRFDHAIFELQSRGIVEKIISKYEKYPNSFYRTATPYKVPQQ